MTDQFDIDREEKYRQAFDRSEWIAVSTVAEELSPTAPDSTIVEFATVHEWVVFTRGDDFFTDNRSHDLLVSS